MRPSDDTRERTMATLRRGYASGSLHTETFGLRIDRALRARSEDEMGSPPICRRRPGSAGRSRVSEPHSPSNRRAS